MSSYIDKLNEQYNNGDISLSEKQRLFEEYKKNKTTQTTQTTQTSEQRLIKMVSNIETKVNFLFGWTIFTIIISVISILVSLVIFN